MMYGAGVRLLLQHRTHYSYPEPAAFGPHVIRLRPASHTKATIETYSLRVGVGKYEPDLRWIQDPYGNHLARVTFRAGIRVTEFDVSVELAVDIKPVNPFDFFIDDAAKHAPFAYTSDVRPELAPFLAAGESHGPHLKAFLADLPTTGETVPLVVELNRRVAERTKYVIRNEPGIWTPEETLVNGRGSCRDSARLLVAVLRSRGLAARFVSGYLVQLTDEGMIPDQPRGIGHDVVDLHAWAEVFLPGGGWIGLDSTSGLLCGEGHIPLASSAEPAGAAPVEGTSSVVASELSFDMKVVRLGHEPRPTAPYEESVWQGILDAGRVADARLEVLGVRLTSGGEPTFNSREHANLPEWNEAALGKTKWEQGWRFALELRRALSPDAVVLERMGKHYPGESLPRWNLELIGKLDGTPAWSLDVRAPCGGKAPTADDARRLTEAIARCLSVGPFAPAFEDPWRFLQDEAALPVDVDPLKADLKDGEERVRLARVLGNDLGATVGFVLPLLREDGGWKSETWQFRRGHLFLIPGDSPIGLRLPLKSLPPTHTMTPPPEETIGAPDPRRKAEFKAKAARAAAPPVLRRTSIHTALCVEARDGALRVFVPPLDSVQDFFLLVQTIDAAARAAGTNVYLEGYAPPSGGAFRLCVSPDPGVLEVNLPPCTTSADHAALIQTVYDAALRSGLQSEKYQLDGRLAGSGGGHHLTLGGTRPLESPLVLHPDLVASWITFTQHHPSLSFLFTGLFVGPTSQAPRVDEARHESIYELEIALAHAFSADKADPWLTDSLFRHLLTDLSGNTHRAELCIDKLFDPATSHGRQGIIELRAFEMPPHPRMAVAQVVLVRAIAAALAAERYQRPLVYWGRQLHDRFLLPHWLWRDFEDVLAHLAKHGIKLDPAAYRPFVELRFPVAGTLRAGDVTVEVRNAIEPWNVLGEEVTGTGTSRYVDASMERIEVRATGLVAERHAILVNGHVLPMRQIGADSAVAGVRFRAWAPPHSLHPHISIHHPIRLDVLDTWGRRSLGGASYHVWHPEGRGYSAPPLTSFEAAARRAQRFTIDGPLPAPVMPPALSVDPDAPYSIDLRRFPLDHPPPPDTEPDATKP